MVVDLGSNITIECKYTGVQERSTIIVTWKFKEVGRHANSNIWIYNGFDKSEKRIGRTDRFQNVNTDLYEKHAISIGEVTLADEGTYICKLEIYQGDVYLDFKEEMAVAITGNN